MLVMFAPAYNNHGTFFSGCASKEELLAMVALCVQVKLSEGRKTSLFPLKHFLFVKMIFHQFTLPADIQVCQIAY